MRRKGRQVSIVVPRQGVRGRQRVGGGQDEGRTAPPRRPPWRGPGPQSRRASITATARPDDHRGREDQAAHRRRRQRPVSQSTSSRQGVASDTDRRARPQLLEDVRARPQVQRHRDDRGARRLAPRPTQRDPAARASARTEDRRDPDDAVGHLGADGAAPSSSPGHARAGERPARARPGRARSPARSRWAPSTPTPKTSGLAVQSTSTRRVPPRSPPHAAAATAPPARRAR